MLPAANLPGSVGQCLRLNTKHPPLPNQDLLDALLPLYRTSGTSTTIFSAVTLPRNSCHLQTGAQMPSGPAAQKLPFHARQALLTQRECFIQLGPGLLQDMHVAVTALLSGSFCSRLRGRANSSCSRGVGQTVELRSIVFLVRGSSTACVAAGGAVTMCSLCH